MIKTWVKAMRPKTLTAAVVPVLVGTAVAAHMGFPVRWWPSLFALLSAMCIQIGTNLFNDVIDFQKGTDTKNRTGPIRATQSGALSSRTVFRGALVSYGCAFVFALPLLWVGGWPVVAIGVMSLLCGYAYTGGPFPLAYRGWGEVFVILFFGIIAVSGVAYLQSGHWFLESFLAGIQVGVLATAMLAINNLRDVEGDRAAHKMTLAARFGVEFGRIEVGTTLLLPFGMSAYWFGLGRFVVGLAPFILIPVAAVLVAGVVKYPPGPKYNLFLAGAAFLHFVFGLLLAGGLFWG